MAYRVVSTKLTEEEHSALLDICSSKGQTPSSFIRASIMERIKSGVKPSATEKAVREADVRTPTEMNQVKRSAPTPESELLKLFRKHKLR